MEINKTVLKKSKVENFQFCPLTNSLLALNIIKIMIGLLPQKHNDPVAFLLALYLVLYMVNSNLSGNI